MIYKGFQGVCFKITNNIYDESNLKGDVLAILKISIVLGNGSVQGSNFS